MSSSFFFKKNKRIYISIKPHDGASGGGANTFSWNLHRYLSRMGIPTTTNLLFASKAIIIGDKVCLSLLRLARIMGCFIIHRLDEHFERGESKSRRRKHGRIIRINKFADVTVFQSEFVKNNVLPYLRTQNWKIIINGADPTVFHNAGENCSYIGHVTNSVGDKKRLDLLEKVIIKYPKEQFLLVGNHKRASIDFSCYPNVYMVGPVSKKDIVKYYQMMKCLYFPSENDPCPNTVVEAIISGVPVCYNRLGGTVEIVRNCGMPLEQFDNFLQMLSQLRKNCEDRNDLHFDSVAQQYMDLLHC